MIAPCLACAASSFLGPVPVVEAGPSLKILSGLWSAAILGPLGFSSCLLLDCRGLGVTSESLALYFTCPEWIVFLIHPASPELHSGSLRLSVFLLVLQCKASSSSGLAFIHFLFTYPFSLQLLFPFAPATLLARG